MDFRLTIRNLVYKILEANMTALSPFSEAFSPRYSTPEQENLLRRSPTSFTRKSSFTETPFTVVTVHYSAGQSQFKMKRQLGRIYTTYTVQQQTVAGCLQLDIHIRCSMPFNKHLIMQFKVDQYNPNLN